MKYFGLNSDMESYTYVRLEASYYHWYWQ